MTVLDLLEERTGLTFPSLRDAVEPEELRPAGPVLVTDAEQVDW
jgi:endonuclease G